MYGRTGKAKQLSFLRKHHLDERAIDSLLKHPTELQDEVMKSFAPFEHIPGHTPHRAYSVLQQLKRFLKCRATAYRSTYRDPVVAPTPASSSPAAASRRPSHQPAVGKLQTFLMERGKIAVTVSEKRGGATSLTRHATSLARARQ